MDQHQGLIAALFDDKLRVSVFHNGALRIYLSVVLGSSDARLVTDISRRWFDRAPLTKHYGACTLISTCEYDILPMLKEYVPYMALQKRIVQLGISYIESTDADEMARILLEIGTLK